MGLEYGIVLERVAPAYIDGALWKVETVYIPRVQAVLRWVPYVNRYVPVAQEYKESVERRKSRPQLVESGGLERSSWMANTSQISSVDGNLPSGRRHTYEVQQDQHHLPSFPGAGSDEDAPELEDMGPDGEVDQEFDEQMRYRES